MIPSHELQRLKQQIAIAELLASRGIYPAHQTGEELAYHSPLRDDNHPSFFVNRAANVFADVVVKEHRGDVIRLVQLLDGVSFGQAVQQLQTFTASTALPAFCLSGSSPPPSERSDQLRQVKLIQTPSLFRYVESRGIGVSLARTYLLEVHYQHKDRYWYAVGMRNDKGGYALRNGVGCKRNLGPAGASTISGQKAGAKTLNLFEGMFDFLSAMQHFGQATPTYPTIVLHSVSNLVGVLPTLKSFTRLNVFFDHDKAGWDALDTLKSHQLPVFDLSQLYVGHNDFNAFLLWTQKNTHQPR